MAIFKKLLDLATVKLKRYTTHTCLCIVASTAKESIADKVLTSCHMLRSCVNQAATISVAMETNNNKASQFEALQVGNFKAL